MKWERDSATDSVLSIQNHMSDIVIRSNKKKKENKIMCIQTFVTVEFMLSVRHTVEWLENKKINKLTAKQLWSITWNENNNKSK